MDRRRQRINAYTFAQRRLDVIVGAGCDDGEAIMQVVGEARTLFGLTAEEWHVLARTLAGALRADVEDY